MGANKWREADDWPIPGTVFADFYLESLGQANTRYGNGALSLSKPASQPADHFLYDPANPVPSIGGHSCCTPDVAPVGPYDQAKVEDRADVLVYSTPPLEKPIEVTGPIQVILYAASSAPDTDFTAKLVDVHPDGKLAGNAATRLLPPQPGQQYKHADGDAGRHYLFNWSLHRQSRS
jgi:uncharacterized protein